MFRIHTDRFARFLVAYGDQSDKDESLVIPEDLTTLSDEDLNALSDEAVSAFDALFGDGNDLSEQDVETLAHLTEGIEAINAEAGTRAEKAAERSAAARELAARVRPEAAEEEAEESEEEDEGPEGEGEDPAEGEAEAEAEAKQEEQEPEAVAASGKQRGDVRVPLSTIRARSRAHTPSPRTEAPTTMRDIVHAADVPGFARGQGLDWKDLGRAAEKRLAGFNLSQYQAAARRDQHIREQNSIATIDRAIPAELTITSGDPTHIEEVLDRAVDQARLPQKSLVASGGWCAPSQVVYDFLELESTDGILSAPEVGISRGGISWSQGPNFADIYNGTGFSFTEQQDIDGEYAPGATEGDPNVVGPKPCYKVGCPDFQEARLDVAGLCITAGVLQSRGYPEVIARTVRGALVAHQHKMAERKINAIAADSTAVSMPTGQVGAAAPLLTSIELQTEHYRYVHRLARGTVLEGIFPYWVRGVVRSDLSRRLGVDLIDVPDARIDGWFRARNISPQFVYNYQDITGEPGEFVAWPTEVKFLLYVAGTWVFGASDVITLDNIYDSVLLGENNYTALFTEEGWLTMKRFADSREVTVPLCGDGATHAGVLIDCDGTAEAAA